MTTKVTVTASGPCYPARLKLTAQDGTVLRDDLIASGHTVEQWVSPGQVVTVTEEYHPDGYAYPAAPQEA